MSGILVVIVVVVPLQQRQGLACGSSQPPQGGTFATSQVLDHGSIDVTLKIGSPEHMCSLLLHVPTLILAHSPTDPGSSQVERRVRVGVVSCWEVNFSDEQKLRAWQA